MNLTSATSTPPLFILLHLISTYLCRQTSANTCTITGIRSLTSDPIHYHHCGLVLSFPLYIHTSAYVYHWFLPPPLQPIPSPNKNHPKNYLNQSKNQIQVILSNYQLFLTKISSNIIYINPQILNFSFSKNRTEIHP